MKFIGLTLLFFGLGPIVANYLGHEFQAFVWMDNWGLQTGLMIKVALIVFGAVLFLPGGRRSRQKKVEPTPAWFPARKDSPYPDPVAGLYNRRRK